MSRRPGPRTGLALWLDALHGLPDNPIARYMALARRRRYLSLPRWRRLSAELITFLIACLLWGGILLYGQLVQPGNMSAREIFSASYFILVVPTYLVWLASNVFSAVRDCAGFLGLGARRWEGLRLDEMLAVSAISNHELLAGILWAVLKPLVAPVISGALLVELTLFVTLGVGGGPTLQTLHQSLLLSPLAVGALVASGLLGALTLGLYAVSLGYGARSINVASTLGSLAAIYTVLWCGISLGLLVASVSIDTQTHMPLSYLLGIAVFFALFALGLELAARVEAATPLIALGVPIFLLLVMIVAWSNSSDWLQNYGEFSSGVTFHFAWSLGALAPLNLLALPSPLCFGVELGDVSLLSYFRWPMLLVLQYALVSLCARCALRAVARCRSSMN